jgi:hypothetical protein
MAGGNFNLNDYVQVNERIEKFYDKYPDGSIQTEIVSNANGEIIIKAYAYKNQEDKHPTTGHAMEKEGSSFINKTSHIENCETSAVGRALAMMGFEIKKSVASKEEVENAKLQQEELAKLIDKNKVASIKSLLEKTKSDEKKFIKFYGITSIESMTNEIYIKAMKALEDKLATLPKEQPVELNI